MSLKDHFLIEHMFDKMLCPTWRQMVSIAGSGDIQNTLTTRPDLADGVQQVLEIRPGRVAELVGPHGAGMTRLGLKLIAPYSQIGPVAVIDTHGWISPKAAWEAGVDEGRLVMVRCIERNQWPRVVAALLEGIGALYAEVPSGIRAEDLRRLTALARARGVAVVMRSNSGALPVGVAYVRFRGLGVTWEGANHGHGRLGRRRILVEASGKGARGVTRRYEIEDEGTDAMCLVSDVVIDQARRSVG